MKKLSVALAVFNEESRLENCLRSIDGLADEIVIVDGGSTDTTLAIAQTFNARVIHSDNPPIFHINKQKAVDACRGEWILQLDADEVVTPELREEILAILSPQSSGFYIPRKNFFCGRWLRKGGQYPDYIIRLFRRGKGKFPCRSVHEQIVIDGSVGYLKEALLHYTYGTLSEYWRKADAYISLTAEELKRDHVPVTISSWINYFILKPISTFLLLFVRHKGFIDGYWGFLFALFSAMHYPLAYRRYVANKS